MADKQKLIDDLNWVTEKISSEIWIINLGTLGTTWALLIASGNVAYPFRLQIGDAKPILIVSLLGLIGELLQHLAAYVNDRCILSRLEKSNQHDFEFETSAFFYRCRIFFFYVKIVLTLVAAVALLLTIYWKVTAS
jgi:hypothetical protein